MSVFETMQRGCARMFSFLREFFPSAGPAVMTVDVEADSDDGNVTKVSRRLPSAMLNLKQKEESKDESESLVSPTASNVSLSSGSAFVAFGSPERDSSDTATGSPTMSPPTGAPAADQLLGAVSTTNKQVFGASFFTALGMFKPTDSEKLGGGWDDKPGGSKPSRLEAALTKNKMWDSRVDEVSDSDDDCDGDGDGDGPDGGKTMVVTALELSPSSSRVKGPTSPARIKATSTPAPKVSSSWHDSAEEKEDQTGVEGPAALPALGLAVESGYHTAATKSKSSLGRIFQRATGNLKHG